jgi:hypothetical protein
MRITTINTGEEHSQYVGQVYQEHYAGLRHYFLTQLDNPSEVDAYVEETLRYFFIFMEDRCWETDVEHMPAYLMRIAGGLFCSKKLAGKRTQGRHKLDDSAANRLFKVIRNEVIQPIKERLEFRQIFLKAEGGSKQLRIKQLSAPRHIPAPV